MYEKRPIKRLYYSISEVSKLTSLRQYVLRYWETEFPELKPAKNRAGNRIYRINDIKLIFVIKKLLYDDKYTIEGARQKLKLMRRKPGDPMNLSLEELRKKDSLFEVKKELEDILEILGE